MNGEPRQLLDVASEVRRIYDACAREDADLFGGSLLDLCADNIHDVSLSDLKSAIVVSGVEVIANARVRRQIAAYSRRTV